MPVRFKSNVPTASLNANLGERAVRKVVRGCNRDKEQLREGYCASKKGNLKLFKKRSDLNEERLCGGKRTGECDC